MTGEMPVEFEARNRLRLIVSRTTELTPLKAVATRAISLAEDERTAAMDLATVISSDQAHLPEEPHETTREDDAVRNVA